MAEQDNEQAGEALLQNARRTLREQPRRAIAGLCVVLLLGLLTAALASSLQRVSADDVCADAVAGAVKPMALSGSYAVDGGEERPYAARQALDAKGIGVEAVTVRGTLENDVAAGELVNMRLSSTACTVRVNGETVFSFDGIGDSEPRASLCSAGSGSVRQASRHVTKWRSRFPARHPTACWAITSSFWTACARVSPMLCSSPRSPAICPCSFRESWC